MKIGIGYIFWVVVMNSSVMFKTFFESVGYLHNGFFFKPKLLEKWQLVEELTNYQSCKIVNQIIVQ